MYKIQFYQPFCSFHPFRANLSLFLMLHVLQNTMDIQKYLFVFEEKEELVKFRGFFVFSLFHFSSFEHPFQNLENGKKHKPVETPHNAIVFNLCCKINAPIVS